MKRFFLSLAAAIAAVAPVMAQTMNVVTGNVTYAFPAAQTGIMPWVNGDSLIVMGKSFVLADITRIYIDDTTVTDNLVSVTYDDTDAYVVVAGNVAQYVTPTVTAAAVSIVQSAAVSDTVCGEITYALQGSSTDGSFYLEGSYKATVELHGLTLTCTTGAPIDIQNGKRIDLSIKSGTVNTLTDCSAGTHKGCIVCKGHLEMKGKGELNVYAHTSHAIYAKEYIEMKNCTVNVHSAVKDGVNCNQYFLMESGTLNISGTGDDGLQVSFKDDIDREAEDTGSITILGGTINADITATAAKGIKADGNVTITGGTITVTTSGGGKWDAEDVKTKASTCISADGYVQIDGGTLSLTSTGCAGKGISCDGDLYVNGGDITVSTSGGIFAYVNGVEYTDYTGNTDNLDSDYKSSPKGIKSDANVTIMGGNINVTTTGLGGEGIESKAIMIIGGGVIEIDAYDDALNATTDITISGGKVYCYSTANDGIDSNGTLNITGGLVIASGTGAPEEGIDCDLSTNFVITGGVVIGTGGAAVSPSTSASTQRTVIYNGLSATQGKTLAILDSSGTPIVTYELPRTMNGMAMLVSAPTLVAGQYTISQGGTLTDYTDSWHGYYEGGTWSNGSQLTSFTSNSIVTTVKGNSGGGPGGGPGGGGPGGGPGGW